MKKITIVTILALIASLSFALDRTITQLTDSSVNIRINTDYRSSQEDDSVKLGIVSQTVALLADDVNIIINNLTIGMYDESGTRVEKITSAAAESQRIYLDNSFIFREMYGFTINVKMIQEENGYQSIIESADFDIVGIGRKKAPENISEAFYHSYKALADNFRSSYLVNIPFKKPAMLIISHSGIQSPLNPFIRWKEERGVEVDVVYKNDIAQNASSTQIRNYIRNYYLEAENKPDYLLLVGDVGGTYSIPTFYHPPQNDATDLPYTMISGDDYFPEMLAGRFSVENAYQLATIVNKTLLYEKNPYRDETDWMKRALIVAGNFATSLPIPITPVLTSKWIAEMLMNSGYTQVDTVFWHVGMGGYGTTQITESLNNGVQLVNYRGWGDANGWHYPKYHISDLSQVQSGVKMPYVTSFVCNTGDFANPTIDPCFGEYWMRMGTPVSPNGSVAFIGPSDLYTSTEYNNSLSSGMHWGIQKEGIRTISSGLLRGKMEMYRNYPNNRGEGDWVEHYFKVYNVLSDPSMKTWVLIPNEMDIELPDVLSAASCHLEFEAPGLSGGYVTITRNDEDFEVFRIDADRVFIPLDAGDGRDIWITVFAENHIPVQKLIEVLPSESLAMIAYDFDGSDIRPGTDITMNVTLKNFGTTEINNVTAQLSTGVRDYVNIIDDSADFGTIEADGTAEGSFVFSIDPECPRYTTLQFYLHISPTEDTAKLQTVVGGILFRVDNHIVESPNNILDPGETTDIEVFITNHGEVDAVNLTAYILAGTDAVQIQEEAIEFGNVAVGESASASFSITASEDAFIGRQVYLQLNFQDEIGLLADAYFNLTLGEVTNTAPTGPDAYGYYAYDSYDVGFEQTPVYNWIDIDPESSDPDFVGVDRWLHDDGTMTMDLPFTFRYYGRDYNKLSICSNGWVSLIPTWMINFRNWSIPSAENPYGIIAPLWDDLKGKPDVGDSLRVAWYYDEPNNRFIVSWLDAYNVARIMQDGVEKIQLILEPREERDGDIVFQYHTVWNQNQNRNYSTTGIQSHCNTMGLEYSFFNNYPPSATPIQAGLAIRVTTDAPDTYTTVEDFMAPEQAFALRQNYPNPFNPETKIEFVLAKPSFVSLDIYNIRGQRLVTLASGEMNAGNHRFIWDGKDEANKEVGSGIYLYKLSSPNGTEVKRMIMLK